MCARCGDSLDRRSSVPSAECVSLCRACRLAPPPFVRAVAFGLYQGRMKAAIHALKYDRLHPAARGLGRMLAKAIAQLAAEAPAEMLVVPVPLHRAKILRIAASTRRALWPNTRSAFLRKSHPGVAADACVEHLDAAARHRQPGRATSASAAAECARRIHGFRSSASRSRSTFFSSTTFLTTGATARAAAQALMRAGAASVMGRHAGPGAPRFSETCSGVPIFEAREDDQDSNDGFIRQLRWRPTAAAECIKQRTFIARTNHLFDEGIKRCRWEKP